MGFSSIKDYVDSEESGKHTISGFRKAATTSLGAAGIWVDFSVYAGNPKPNFYASEPLAAATLNGNFGIYHGQNVTTSKFLKRVTIPTPHGTPPHVYMLCDYLLYYPFIDGDETSEQALTNTVTLPRYTDGVGVQAFLVSQSTYVGGQTYSINYTNSDGVSGQVSRLVTPASSSGVAGTLLMPAVNSSCFIPLQDNDKGIRSVQSITMNGPNGGLHALVLAKPIAMVKASQANAPVEKDFLTETAVMPKIENGAYLSFLVFNSVNTGANFVIFGSLETVWGDN